MPVPVVKPSPNTRNWEKLSSSDLNEATQEIIDSIIEEFKRHFPNRSGFFRISSKRKSQLYRDINTAILTYAQSIEEEIAINNDAGRGKYQETIGYLSDILNLSLKIDEEHVFLFESYCRKAADDHFLSKTGQKEIYDFIVHLSFMIKIPRGRRSNLAVNNVAEPCISAIENFMGIKFPKTTGATVGEFTTKEAQIFFFILKKIERNITSSMARTALKHAIAWRKKLNSEQKKGS